MEPKKGHMIPKLLRKPHEKATKDIDNWVKKNYPEGMEVVHIQGKYKGRRAVLKSVFWENSWFHEGYSVMVTVETRALKGNNAFIDSNDSYHRTFGNFDQFFKKWNVHEQTK